MTLEKLYTSSYIYSIFFIILIDYKGYPIRISYSYKKTNVFCRIVLLKMAIYVANVSKPWFESPKNYSVYTYIASFELKYYTKYLLFAPICKILFYGFSINLRVNLICKTDIMCHKNVLKLWLQ